MWCRINLPKLTLCILILVVSRASLRAAEFSTAANYSITADPYSAVVADFNGDGKLDTAFTNGNDHVISVMLGNGDGTLQTAVTFPAGASPVGLATGDLNHDGNLDLVFADRVSQNVGALLGNGDGTFQSPLNTAVSIAQPYGVALADLDGDGKLDVAVTNSEFRNGAVVVMLGNGDGTFRSLQTYSTHESYAGGVAIVDFDKDGLLDLAVANSCTNSNPCTTGTVSLLLGNGNGTFKAATNFPAGFSTFSVVVTDFNNDGNLDLGVCDETDIGVMLGHGDGTFEPEVTYQPGSNVIFGIATADVNGDGNPDLISASTNSDSVSVLLGRGDGTFLRRNDYGVGSSPVSVATGDFNGDGSPDIVAVGGYSSGAASMLLNTGGIAVAQISPKKLDFGNVKTHTISPAQVVTLTNTGNAPMNISGIGLVGADKGAFRQTNNCGSTLAAGASCTVSVKFGPFGARRYAADLGFADDAVGHRQSVQLNGVGIP